MNIFSTKSPLHSATCFDKNLISSIYFFPFNTSRFILELNHSKGLDDLGVIKWDLALCLLVVYIICYFSLWKGISTSGKVNNTQQPFPVP